jgi:flagellar hook-associated protein 3 FlgL
MMAAINNSTLAFYNRTQSQTGGLRARAEQLQSQLSTGAKFARSSDDPVAASRLRSLQRFDRLGTIDAGNARSAAENLDLASRALESIGSDIIRARELALFAASDTVGDSERATIAVELAEIRLRIMASANGLDNNGNALLGGENSGRAYEIDPGGAVVYIGSVTSGTIDLGQGQSVVRGITGPEVLSFTSGGVPTDIFAELAALTTALTGGAADPAAAARDALGGLDDALDTLTRAQTVTGSRIAWLDIVQDRQTDQSLTRAQQIADTGGVAIASAVTELQQIINVLEASQAGFIRLAGLTLFDRF